MNIESFGNAFSKPRPKIALAHERVFRSTNDILYLAGGSNGAASLYTEAGFRRGVDHNAWNGLLRQRKAAIEATGSKFVQLIVPEKLTIYPLADADRRLLFPEVDACEVLSPGQRLLRELDIGGIVYPEKFLNQQREVLPIYQATDSHWTWQGAFSAFQVLMWQLGYRPDYRNYVTLPQFELRYRGDLWEPCFEDIATEKFVRINLPSYIRRVYANPLVGFKEKMGLHNESGLHVGSHCIFQNPCAEFKETVVLFGSSFSEYRLDPSLLTSIFSFYFELVHFVWSSSIDYSYVDTQKPNITIAEIPERFLTAVPQDSEYVERCGSEKVNSWRKRYAISSKKISNSNEDENVNQETEAAGIRLFIWKRDKVAICKKIAENYSNLKILLKTKDEPGRLKHWIAHHSAIVGKENLIIFDNMSTDRTVLSTYAELSDIVPIIRYDTFHDLVHHTLYFSELYEALRLSCSYFIFLDTDEYLALYRGGDQFFFDSRLVDFLDQNRETKVFPCTWLPNLQGHFDRFHFRETGWPLFSGLQWGKPILSTKSNASGIIQHNTQIDHTNYRESLLTNFFLLHRNNVCAEERIRVNLNKLISYGALKPDSGIDEALSINTDTMEAGQPKSFLLEIRRWVEAGCNPSPDNQDFFEIRRNGKIVWIQDWQRAKLQSFIQNPFEYSSGLFSQ